MKRVFLDATCWVAAAGSPDGGSAQILKLARAGKLVLLATQSVLQEAERNIRDAWGETGLERYYEDVGEIDLELIDLTTAEEEARWETLTVEKDRHVLAGAYKGGADVLVTLDRRHLLTEQVVTGFPIPIQDTRRFFEMWYAEAVKEP